MSLNDKKYNFISSILEKEGNINDLELEYLQLYLNTSEDNIADLKQRYLDLIYDGEDINNTLDDIYSNSLKTTGMTLDYTWDDQVINYLDIGNVASLSVKLYVYIEADDEGVIFETGATGYGLNFYAYNGNFYFNGGQGDNYTPSSQRFEASCPIVPGYHIIELSASRFSGNGKIFIDGKLMATANAPAIPSYLAGTDAGGIGQVHSSVVVNRGGWTSNGTGVFTGTVTKALIYEGEEILE